MKAVEEAGAGALVIKSLFEEQILHERGELEEALSVGGESFSEALNYFPRLEHAGAKEHLIWVKKAREAVTMPLFASLNAVSPGTWVEYAKALAETGVDGIELNTYAVQADLRRNAEEVEARLSELVAAVKDTCGIPVAVKLSPFYTVLPNVVRRLDDAGADALILFNRFLQPDIDVEAGRPVNKMTWSTQEEMRLPLRWIGLLFGYTKADLIGNTGAWRGTDLARYILAGAVAVQVAGAVCRNGAAHITQMLDELDNWMNAKGYADLAAFRGKCSQAEVKANPLVFERAQYVDFLLGQDVQS
jgi:dihydroorotate dehydrogenase (fumarate)